MEEQSRMGESQYDGGRDGLRIRVAKNLSRVKTSASALDRTFRRHKRLLLCPFPPIPMHCSAKVIVFNVALQEMHQRYTNR